MFPVTSFRILYRAIRQWNANQDSRQGAALAYYTLFSITPLLIFAITITSLVFDEERARQNLFQQLHANLDKESADAIQTLIQHARKPAASWAPIVGIAVLVVGALGVFLHVRSALCTIWKLEPPRGNTWLGLLLDYALALAMVLITGLLLLASLVASTVLPLVIEFVQEKITDTTIHWQLVELGVSFFLLTLLFASMYRVLSGSRIPWHYVWYGSFIAAILFSIGKTLMGYYLRYFSPASYYGAAGSVMVFLLWVYYSSHTLFFGAELIQARRTRKEWLKKNMNDEG